jgi:hypothetical protein
VTADAGESRSVAVADTEIAGGRRPPLLADAPARPPS